MKPWYWLAGMTLLIAAGALFMLWAAADGWEQPQIQAAGGEQAPPLKPTTSILESIGGTATAESEQVAPVPSTGKTAPPPNILEWWDSLSLDRWVQA